MPRIVIPLNILPNLRFGCNATNRAQSIIVPFVRFVAMRFPFYVYA